MNQRRFSNAAATYDQHAAPQRELADTLMRYLPTSINGSILEVGAGTGILTEKLITHFPETPIDAIDIAEEMVEQSREKFIKQPCCQWVLADAQTYYRDEPYALIASSAALHWSSDLLATLNNLYSLLQPGGLFVLGIMLRGTLWELRELRRAIAPGKGGGPTLPLDEIVQQHILTSGFSLEKAHTAERRHIYENGRAFLQAIHDQGVTALQQQDYPLNRSELSALIHAYETRHATAGGVYATYQTGSYLLSRPESASK
jgi:malonyl-CoA O-methyltransferase